MQRTHALVAMVARGSRWGLPWICALAISSSLAYAVNIAVSGGPAGSVAQPSISAAQTLADSHRSLDSERCIASVGDPMFARVDMDSSIVAETRRATCGRTALIGFDGSESSRCGASDRALLYVGLNTWIRDPSVACQDDAP